jgi:hypothetical protein
MSRAFGGDRIAIDNKARVLTNSYASTSKLLPFRQKSDDSQRRSPVPEDR